MQFSDLFQMFLQLFVRLLGGNRSVPVAGGPEEYGRLFWGVTATPPNTQRPLHSFQGNSHDVVRFAAVFLVDQYGTGHGGQ